MRYTPIAADFYIQNRQILAQKFKKNSMAVFTANTFYKSSGDGEAGFKQNSSFFYLTGIDQEDCKLILLKTESAYEEFLFIAETNDKIRVWEGEKLSLVQARLLSGIKNIYHLSQFWSKIQSLGKGLSIIYGHLDLIHAKNTEIQTVEKQFLTRLKKSFSGVKFLNPAPWVNEQRLVKDPREIVQIQKAIDISAEAFKHLTKTLKPGLFEYQAEAELSYKMAAMGSRYPAFHTIMASGANACVLHYIKNDKICKEGDSVLIDFGAEYGGYNADVSRVLPVGASFTTRQKDVYQAVLEVLYYLKKYIKPGELLSEIRAETRIIIGQKLQNLNLASKISDEVILKYFPHGPCHFLGLVVHDVGDKSVKLSQNMLITCEPGIYIHEEGIGVRLENDLLITKNGNHDLCEAIPIEINEIEKLKQQ